MSNKKEFTNEQRDNLLERLDKNIQELSSGLEREHEETAKGFSALTARLNELEKAGRNGKPAAPSAPREPLPKPIKGED